MRKPFFYENATSDDVPEVRGHRDARAALVLVFWSSVAGSGRLGELPPQPDQIPAFARKRSNYGAVEHHLLFSSSSSSVKDK